MEMIAQQFLTLTHFQDEKKISSTQRPKPKNRFQKSTKADWGHNWGLGDFLY